ncbi:hypothetical protein ACSBR1_041563 [Camellia fascicularis]
MNINGRFLLCQCTSKMMNFMYYFESVTVGHDEFGFLITYSIRYMGHLNGKVARASHSLFVAFVSSRKDSNDDKRVLLKEQLVFYHIQRSLEGYPGITPFEGMASGVAALVRHLPAGSPSIFYTIQSC